MRRVERLAVLDRIEDAQHAVLLVGDPPEYEFVVSIQRLPEGARAGHWLRVTIDSDQLVSATIDEQATEAAKRRVGSKMEQLQRRSRRLG